jgi:hypothetical protein
MKKFLLLIAIINCMAIGSRAQTVQCQTTSGAWGPCPLNASVQLFTTQAATATATATAQKVYNFNMTGTFLVTYAGITGSPATCTLQVKTGDSLGNVSNNNTALSLTPATGSTTIAFAPTSTQQQGDQMTVVYACGTYPTAGTISVEFVPSTSAPLPPGSSTIGAVTQASGPWSSNQTQLNSVALGSPSNYGTSPGAVSVAGVNAYITNSGSINAVPPVALAQGVNTIKTSSTAVTTLAQAFGSNTTAGNSIACVAYESAAAVPTIADGQSNTYIVAVSSATAPGYTVVVAENIVGGTTDTVTETFTSGAGTFACWEFKNGVTIGQAWDYATAVQAASGTLNFQQQSATLPLEMVIASVGMGGGTVNATPSIAGNNSSLTTIDQSNVNPDSGGAGAALSDVYTAHTFTSGIPSGFIQSLSLSASETYSGVLFSVKPIAQTTATTTSVASIGGQAVSLYATLFSGTAATATATSFAVRTPGQSGYGDLEITGSGITGSPSGCTIALAYQSNTGSPTGSTQATVSFTPGNSLQVLPVVPTNPTGDQYVATYACSTYPTAGTISVAFAPTTPVVIAGTLPAAIISGQQAVTASAVALASNALTKGICIEALSTNSISVFVGPSGVTTSTGIELPAKSSYCTSVANSNALYVIASTTGASVTWSGN